MICKPRNGTRIPAAILFMMLCLTAPAGATDTYGSTMGAGLMLGNPLGLNLKAWVAEEQAIDGGFGLGFLGGEHIQVHSTYLFHFEGFEKPTAAMKFYLGLGLAMDINENRKRTPLLLYLRPSAGLAFTFPELKAKDVPLDFFIEAAPLLGKDVKVDANLGARYWF